MTNNYENLNYQDIQESKQKYQSRRRKIFKGKVAPTGSVFISISFKRGKMKYESTQHIKGGLSSEQELIITDSMYNSLCDKYHLKR